MQLTLSRYYVAIRQFVFYFVYDDTSARRGSGHHETYNIFANVWRICHQTYRKRVCRDIAVH